MLRALRLAASGWAALAVASCCTLPAEREMPRAHKAALATPKKPLVRQAKSSKEARAAPVVAAQPSIVQPPVIRPPVVAQPFPKAACKGPRPFQGKVEGGKIVGGWEASIGDWPGFVAIRVRTEETPDAAVYVCGGSAIAPNWVLTAAHCVHGKLDGQDERGPYQNMKSRWGSYGLSGKGYLEVVAGADHLAPVEPRAIRVKRPIVYSEYASGGGDIALLELAEPLAGPFARVSLSKASDPPDVMPTRSMVAGFGRIRGGQDFDRFPTTRGGTVFAMSDALLETTVPTPRKGMCSVGDGQICAAEARYGGRDTCGGDSGGPLVLFDRDKCPYVVGLTSFGPGDCGSKGGYGVYTRISSYAAWIRKYVPTVATTPAPFDRAAMEAAWRDVWGSVEAIHKRAAALPPERQVPISLCGREGPGCVPRGDGPLQDGEGFRVGASVPAGRIVIVAVSSQGHVRQVHPTDQQGEVATMVAAEARASWSFDEGRLIALALPADAALPHAMARARDDEGKVVDAVAYMRSLEAVARGATGIGVKELSVRQERAKAP